MCCGSYLCPFDYTLDNASMSLTLHRCYTIRAADTANGFVVSICSRLEKLGVCLSAQNNHLVDGFDGFKRLERARGLQVNAVVPIDLLREGIGSFSKLFSSIANLIGEGRCSTPHSHACVGVASVHQGLQVCGDS